MKLKFFTSILLILAFSFSNVFADIKYQKNEENKNMADQTFIKITQSFNDPVSQVHFAPGEWQLDSETAHRLQKEGRGKVISEPSNPDNFVEQVPDSEKKIETQISNQESENNIENTGADNIGNEIPPVDPGTSSGQFEKTGEVLTKTPLPENTPERDKLIAAGIDSLEKLKAATQEDLLKVDKVGQATVSKIGLFLADLK